MSVLRLKVCVRLPLNQILKMFISSDFTFYILYGDIYFSMVMEKATRIRMILRKTPLKVYRNLKSTGIGLHSVQLPLLITNKAGSSGPPCQVQNLIRTIKLTVFSLFQPFFHNPFNNTRKKKSPALSFNLAFFAAFFSTTLE